MFNIHQLIINVVWREEMVSSFFFCWYELQTTLMYLMTFSLLLSRLYVIIVHLILKKKLSIPSDWTLTMHSIFLSVFIHIVYCCTIQHDNILLMPSTNYTCHSNKKISKTYGQWIYQQTKIIIIYWWSYAE